MNLVEAPGLLFTTLQQRQQGLSQRLGSGSILQELGHQHPLRKQVGQRYVRAFDQTLENPERQTRQAISHYHRPLVEQSLKGCRT